MSKKSNRGKGYFYAMGQRDKHNGVELTGGKLREMRRKLTMWAHHYWICGYHGY